MTEKKITFDGNTDLGKVRTNNEDTFIIQNIWDDNHVLAVVIDGVGGYDGGEIAAQIAQQTIIEYLERYTNGERIDLLKQAVTEANNRVVEEREKQPKFANMGCVLTACLVEVDKMQINMVHVGDTRLYQYYNNELQKLSHDHSLIGYREEIGDLTEDEAMNHSQRNVIGRDVGSQQHLVDDKEFLEAVIFPLLPDSTLLLCSDGLSDMLKSVEIASVLKRNIPLNEKTRVLIDFANQKGGKDNVTVVLLEYNGAELKHLNTNQDRKAQRNDLLIAPEKKSTKKSCLSLKNILLALLVFLLGAICGWWGHSQHPCVESQSDTNVIPMDLPNNVPQDTLEVEPNNPFRIYIIGKELKVDTVEINQ